ncbi:MAG: hypothetical protein AAFP04_08485 [Myxococcota bacterium]
MKSLLTAVCAASCFIFALGARAQSPDGPSEILRALPQSADGALNIEGLVLIRDLHRIDEFYQNSIKRFDRFDVTREYFSSAHQKSLLGFDLYGEIARLAKVATPSGAPAPMAIAAFSNKGQFGVQLLMRVEDGFMDRLKAEQSAKSPLPWPAAIDGQSLTIPVMDSLTLFGQVTGGWLRIAPDKSMLIGSEGTPATLYSKALAPYFERHDVAFLLRPGVGSSMLGDMSSEPMLEQVAQSFQGLLFGVELSDDLSVGFRVVVESGMLKPYASAARRAELQNWFVSLVDTQATSVFAISIPPAALDLAAQLAQALPVEDVPGAQDLVALLQQIDGRIGFLGFDTPGDWALAMRFKSEDAAKSLAPKLHGLLTQSLRGVGVSEQDFALLESFPGLKEQVLHLRPDVLIDGVRIVPLGANVVTVPKRGRLERLIAASNPNGEKGKKSVASLVEGPLTPLVKETLETPAMALAYSMMRGDGAIFDYLLLPSKMLSVAFTALMSSMPEMGVSDLAMLNMSGLERLPLSVGMAMISWLTTYDLALAVDVRDELLVFELVSSQI